MGNSGHLKNKTKQNKTKTKNKQTKQNKKTKKPKNQKEEKKKHKEQINNLNNNLTKLKAEIQEKKKLVQSLKANSNPQKIPKKTASCLCSSCHAKQVECVIVGCGHTFCEACLLNLKSCPKCNHIITENDVCKVNWF